MQFDTPKYNYGIDEQNRLNKYVVRVSKQWRHLHEQIKKERQQERDFPLKDCVVMEHKYGTDTIRMRLQAYKYIFTTSMISVFLLVFYS